MFFFMSRRHVCVCSCACERVVLRSSVHPSRTAVDRMTRLCVILMALLVSSSRFHTTVGRSNDGHVNHVNDDETRRHSWHGREGTRLSKNEKEARFHLMRAIFPSTTNEEDLNNDLPHRQAFGNLGVHYMRTGRLEEAAKYLSIALHMSPFGSLENENWDALKRQSPKNSLCPWKGNALVGKALSDDLGSIGMLVAESRSDAQSVIYFAADVHRKFETKSGLLNAAITLYRESARVYNEYVSAPDGSKAQAERYDRLTSLRRWSLYCFERYGPENIGPENMSIYNFLNGNVRSEPFRRSHVKVRLCRKSALYTESGDHFVEGIVMLYSHLNNVASFYLKRAYRLDKRNTVVAAAYAYALFKSRRTDEALLILDEILSSSSSSSDIKGEIQFAREFRELILKRQDQEFTTTRDDGHHRDDVVAMSIASDGTSDTNADIEVDVATKLGYVKESTDEDFEEWWTWRRDYLRRHALYTSWAKQGRLKLKKARFLVMVVPDVGFGNQVASIVSSLLLAMLTRRTLLLHFPPAIGHTWHAIKDAVDFPGMSLGMPWTYADVVDHFDIRSVSRHSQILVIHEETEKTDPDTLEALLCKKMDDYLESPFVYMSSNLHFYRFLEINPHYKETLSKVFRGDVFGRLARFMIRPSAAVRDAASVFVSRHFRGRQYVDPEGAPLLPSPRPIASDGTLVVGVHLRSGMDSNSRDRAILFNHARDAVLRAAGRCLPAALTRERGADRTLDDGTVYDSFRDVVVFVACDNADLRQEALKVLRKIEGVVDVVAYAPSQAASRDHDGMFFAVTDLFLLSQADVIVRTGKITSMFTSLAAGLMVQGTMQPVYMAPVTTREFYQCKVDDSMSLPCGVSLNRDLPRLGIVESVLTNHAVEVGTCMGGVENASKILRDRRALYPNCDELLDERTNAWWTGFGHEGPSFRSHQSRGFARYFSNMFG